MRNPDLCKKMLERILPELNIGRIEYPELQKTIKNDIDARGIRLVVYVKDSKEVVYDIVNVGSGKSGNRQKNR